MVCMETYSIKNLFESNRSHRYIRFSINHQCPLLIASSMSYLISENVNAYILYKIKSFTNSKYLYIRVLTSTILAAAIDSILFITIAFHDSFDNSIIEKMIITQFLIKSTYALIGVLPIYAIR